MIYNSYGKNMSFDLMESSSYSTNMSINLAKSMLCKEIDEKEACIPITEELSRELWSRNIMAFRIVNVFDSKKTSLLERNLKAIFSYIEFVSSDGQMAFVYDDIEGYNSFYEEFKKCFCPVEPALLNMYTITSIDREKMYFFRYLMFKEMSGYYSYEQEEQFIYSHGKKHYFFSPLEGVIQWASSLFPQFNDAVVDVRDYVRTNIKYIIKEETINLDFSKGYINKWKDSADLNDAGMIKSVDLLIQHYCEMINSITQGDASMIVGNEIHKLYVYFVKVKERLEADRKEFLMEIQIKESEDTEENNRINHTKNNGWGEQGEQEVEYALKWLPKGYIAIKRDCVSKYEKECILLKNNAISDEIQEIDHIVIGTQGVFLIETKYYKGKIIIDSNGNWIREDETGKQKGTKNPVQQIDRHHYILKSILEIDEIQDIICIAHDEAIIEGTENSLVPIIKADMIVRYITEYKTGRIFSDEEKIDMLNKIEKYKIKKMNQ